MDKLSVFPIKLKPEEEKKAAGFPHLYVKCVPQGP